ncbi:hypothetical protein DICPUDRAFT_89226 [Dictyostelium purpureum]|uniref:Ataxin-10 domain-containing protein n=1 Tax=Dictyostelium purpureum TaxID=5786 RepID=F0ZUG2_DICPU|nr:uncharacterized protein DICPUDRAFT_89226 [Dictyostelium purpureum]EGC32408.1 hypothetical protein DICPUDRAFT_89226 [Dictyostelium purpureum]|eukprot:XP_003291055.1 hypothetical protein DICPUDRAFT_89226 [Dictyostelium purpureum]
MINQITELLNLSKDFQIRKDVSKFKEFLNQLMGFIITNNNIKNEKLYKFNLLSIRFLRNLCANVNENQDIIVSNDLFINYLLQELIENSNTTLDNEIENNRKKNILVALQQLLINSIVQNENTQTLLWDHYKLFPNKLFLLINNNRNDCFKILPTNLMLIYNLILNSKERMKEISRSESENNNNNNNNIEFIKSILDLIKDEDNSNDEEYEDTLFHWIHLIFKLLFKNQQFIEIYKLLSTAEEIIEVVPNTDYDNLPTSGKTTSTASINDIDESIPKTKTKKYYKDGKTNRYQIKLLNLLDSTINDNEQKNVKEYIENNSIIDIKTCFYMLDELSILYNMDFSRKDLSGETQKTTTALNQFDFDAVFFFIKIFANITTYSDEMVHLQLTKYKTNDKNSATQEVDSMSRVLSETNQHDNAIDPSSTDKYDLNTLLRKKGLVGICIGSLHGNYDGSNTAPPSETDQDNTNIKTKGFNQSCESEDKGFKKEIIRILGNLAHKNFNNQNEIRELGGIELILNHCRFDIKNPYIKEWSVFAIRNLCEENQENQNVINNLKMEGIANQKELNDLGIEVGVENGAVKFKNAPKK